MIRWRCFFLLWVLAPLGLWAHEVRPAYLELREVEPDTYDLLWKVPAAGDDLRLGIYVHLPTDIATIGEPRAWFADRAYLERSRIQRPGGLNGATVRFDGLSAAGIDVLARIESLDGTIQTTRVMPDAPTLHIERQPSQLQVVSTYTVIGIEHILGGIDHLLFVLALFLVVKGWRRLLGTITAFTGAHSLTLAAATLGWVHVPGPPVEATIALSIVFVAAEILHGEQGRTGLTARAPWLIAFTFGLLHGLGFAGALSEVGLPSQAIPLALLFFNVGVEIGQLAFVSVLVLAVAAIRRLPTAPPDWSRRVLPYAIGSVAMFWVIERTAAFLP